MTDKTIPERLDEAQTGEEFGSVILDLFASLDASTPGG